MKKNILFVIPSLGVGGAERSLIELLNKFDYSRYNVDLLIFRFDGLFLNKINKNVKIIRLTSEEETIMMNGRKSLKCLFKIHKYNIIIRKILVSIIFRLFGNLIIDSQLFWSFFKKYFNKNKHEYDVAISYLQGRCAYYTIDKIVAKKKILWMHTDYGVYSKNSRYDKKYTKQFNEIVTVSKSACDDFIRYHPEKKDNVNVIYNIINMNSILNLSNESNELENNAFKIVSVGRLHYSKGFDLVVPAIKQLIKDGFNVKWYVVGEGKEREKLEKMIKQFKLEEYCYLLGLKENPYSYINSADIYLQSSRYEGYCITLAEARALCKPIVSTDFFGAREQLHNMKTGLVVKCDTNNIYNGLRKLIKDLNLRNEFTENLSREHEKNDNEILKVYNLLDK